jgi:hypothetical protein
MKMTRIGVVLLASAAIVLAGCQSPKEGQGAKSAAAKNAAPAADPVEPSFSKDGKGSSSGVFDARLKAAMASLMVKSLTGCSGQSTDAVDAMSCVSGKIALALDPSGEANRQCARFDGMEKYLQCAFFGVILRQLRAGNGVEMTADSWSKAQKIMEQELMVLAVSEGMDCYKAGGSKSLQYRECLSETILPRFGGESADAEPCLGIEDEYRFGQCLGEAGLVRIFETAVENIGS